MFYSLKQEVNFNILIVLQQFMDYMDHSTAFIFNFKNLISFITKKKKKYFVVLDDIRV